MRLAAAVLLTLLLATPAARGAPATGSALLLNGTVVTMDDAHRVMAEGHVLIRDGLIDAVWSGSTPSGLDLAGARQIDAGARGLIFPGLINLHDHPPFAVVSLWPPPTSHRQPASGRSTGREPYDHRYEWTLVSPAEFARLVQAPRSLGDADTLALQSEMLVHSEVRAALGGTTAIQGEPADPASGLVVRDVDGVNFGRDKIEERVQSIDNFGDSARLAAAMAAGRVDAWLVHLAEGVRDGERAPGDTFSSRHEFDTLLRLQLLTSSTVILHGVALERSDFARMHAADAKLVWSPLTNLLLYGRTANVYDALAAGVTVSLGTDWTPSGSKTLLDELKVADIALRDRRIIGAARSETPDLADEGALDQLLIDMVTRNPAQTLRWAEVGSIEPGKHADLLVIRRPAGSPTGGMPASPYRSLIDATERDVHLVLVDGKPVAGDLAALDAAGATSIAKVRSVSGRYVKGVAFRDQVPTTRLRLATVEQALRSALRALGGDDARAASGPASRSATFSYLRRRWSGGRFSGLSESAFRDTVLKPRYGLAGKHLNLERIELAPLFTDDDDFFFTILEGRRTRRGLPADSTPPFRRYRVNVNQARGGGNPFTRFWRRWYQKSG